MRTRPVGVLVGLGGWALVRKWWPERLAASSANRVTEVPAAATLAAALVVSRAALAAGLAGTSPPAPAGAKTADSAAGAAPPVATAATTAPSAPNRAKVSDTDHWPVGSQK